MTRIDCLYARAGRKKDRDKIPSRAACFRKEGAERSGPGTDSGSRGYNKPTWTSSRSTVISREEHPDSCRKLARGPWTLGKTAKHAVLAADYSVFIPVCLPWGILPSGLEAPNKSAETVPRHALAVRVAMLVVICRARGWQKDNKLAWPGANMSGC